MLFALQYDCHPGTIPSNVSSGIGHRSVFVPEILLQCRASSRSDPRLTSSTNRPRGLHRDRENRSSRYPDPSPERRFSRSLQAPASSQPSSYRAAPAATNTRTDPPARRPKFVYATEIHSTPGRPSEIRRGEKRPDAAAARLPAEPFRRRPTGNISAWLTTIPPQPTRTPGPEGAVMLQPSLLRRRHTLIIEKKMTETDFTLPPATFEFLVFSLKLQAEMRLMGDMPEPGESQPAEPVPDLTGARHAIDLLAMLEEKTRGNLSLEERRILENSLTELRFRYVQATEKVLKKTNAG